MLFLSQKKFILIRRQTLEIYNSNKKPPHIVNISTDAIDHLEIKNPQLLLQELQAAAKQYRLKPGKVTLLLDDAILFRQITDAANPLDIKTFSTKIPFENVNTTAWQIGDQITYAAVNQEYLAHLTHSLETIGYHIQTILPLSAFASVEPDQPLPPQQRKLIAKSNLSKHIHFQIPQ